MDGYGLRTGDVELGSAGPITFGPDGILFLADNVAAKVFAVDVGRPRAGRRSGPFDLDDVDARVALATSAATSTTSTSATWPCTRCPHNVYLSVQRGRGDAAQAVLVRIDRARRLDRRGAARRRADVAVTDRRRTRARRRAAGHHAPARRRGRGAHRSASATVRILRRPDPHLDRHRHGLRRRHAARRRPLQRGVLLEAAAHPVPVRRDPVTDNNLEIFHVSHGKWETAAPIRTFVPYDGGRSILASYTCTPVVHFPLADLEPGTKTVGRDRRRARRREPAARHGLVPAGRRGAPAGGQQPPTAWSRSPAATSTDRTPLHRARASRSACRARPRTSGASRRLANLNGSHVLVLQRDEDGRQHLRSLKTASL